MRMSMQRKAGAIAALIGMLAAACTSGDDPERESGAGSPEKAPSQTPIEVVTEAPKDWMEAACSLPIEQLQRVRRGYVRNRSPEILFVPREPNFFGGFTSTTHSGPWDYVQRVPMVFYGPGFIKSQGDLKLERETSLADLAPTLAELLKTPFPEGRSGEAITEALLPEGERDIPKMILTVVWDGGGWNVLDTWPKAWPFLDSMMRKGASVQDVVVGSSPSVTPAVHATIGTGTFPFQHGIVDIPHRDGPNIVGAYEGKTPTYLNVSTLADEYDQAVGNEAEIGMLAYKSWHLGMIGHGAYMEGGDHDIAVIAERDAGELVTNPEWYSLPPYLEEVPGFEDYVREIDLTDGEIDSKWMGHEILDDPRELRHTPVWAKYQTDLLTTLFDGEKFGRDEIADLFFVNYKQVDDIGHDYNMLNPEMREILKYSDEELEKLTRYLDDKVGKNEWVVVYTADHGQSPDPLAAQAWPIRIQLLQEDVSKKFDTNGDDVDLYQDERPVGFWLDAAEMDANGVTEEEIADFLIDYRLEDNLQPDEDIDEQYRKRLKEPLFSAAFPSRRMNEIWQCATERSENG